MTPKAAGSAGHSPTELGTLVRALRAKAGLTRKQLAKAASLSERYLAHLEAGDGNPSLSVLAALADALDLTLPELLPRGGERSERQAHAIVMVRRLPEERLDALERWLAGELVGRSAKARRIALVGLRGAGKSSLGTALAKRFRMPFLEISKEVERVYGAPVGILLELSGQTALRRYESEIWEGIVQAHEAAVIAVPGAIVAEGVLYDRVLGTAHTVWLRASPEDHMKRVMAQGDFRPMASNRSAMADLKIILDARLPEYARADVELDTSEQAFEPTLDLLVRLAGKLTGEGRPMK